MKCFIVVGIFCVGVGELDGGLLLIYLEDVVCLQCWKINQVQGLCLKFDDLFQVLWVVWEIVWILIDNDFYVCDWMCSYGNLYQVICMEKIMIGLLLLLIVVVVVFNIIFILVMVVIDKKLDIVIFCIFGVMLGQIMVIFMVQGMVIGVIGMLVGGVFGVVVVFNVSVWIFVLEKLLGYQFFVFDVYFIDYLLL